MDTLFNGCFYDTFYQKIIPDYFDTAFLNEPYEFLIELDTFNVDSLEFSVEYITGDFMFDETTGLVTGLPREIGAFLCIITVLNHDMEGIVTDMIYDEIKVVNPTHIPENSLSSFVNVNPNPFSTSTTIQRKVYLFS